VIGHEIKLDAEKSGMELSDLSLENYTGLEVIKLTSFNLSKSNGLVTKIVNIESS
jgi:hypothetical protein